MNNTLLQSERQTGPFAFDPRSKMALLLTGSILMITGSNSAAMAAIKFLLMALPFLLLLLSGRPRQALLFLAVYLAATGAVVWLLPYLKGLPAFLVVAAGGILGRFLPIFMLGYSFVSTTTVSEFIAAMELMHLPNAITIPLSVIFRFFPTVAEEYANINDAMRMRGISFGFTNPGAMLEYRVIPLITCTVQIGEELSATALTRGLGAPVKRTSICSIGLRLKDFFVFLFCISSLLVFFYEKLYVLTGAFPL
ncbi:MAG: energy-coupling factor transporter transmembrane component T [Oscillospiraceae bacterium]